MNNKGSLQVQLDVSYLLKDKLSIDVWDSELQHCSTIRDMERIDLNAGTYQITSVLSDGHIHKKVVEIKSGQESTVIFREQSTEYQPRVIYKNTYQEVDFHPQSRVYIDPESNDEWDNHALTGLNEPAISYGPLPSTKIMVGTGSIVSYPDRYPKLFKFDHRPVITEIAAHGAHQVSTDDNLIIFEADEHFPDEISSVEITFDNGFRYLVSLPINKGSGFHHRRGRSCLLEINRTHEDISLYAKFDPDCELSSALQNMLRGGKILNATQVVRDANEMLWEKYEDPVGATLGALILFKIGALKERKKWLINLALRFGWIPDGRVLLSTLMLEDMLTLDKALEYALEASEKKLLFTDTFSILLNLLKHWPHEIPKKYETRYQRSLDRLSHIAIYVDWAALTLSYRIP